jgi:hypothetical protein
MLSDVFGELLRLVAEFLQGIIEAGEMIARAIVGGTILIVVFWGISTAMAPLTGRVERTSWWRTRFGYRYGFWEVAIPTMMGLCFAAMVLTVIWGFATGRLPAR